MASTYTIRESEAGEYDIVAALADGREEVIAHCGDSGIAAKIEFALNLVEDSFSLQYPSLPAGVTDGRPRMLMATVKWEVA